MALVFEVLTGLPAYGEAAEAFSRTGIGLHSEGLVVKFEPHDQRSWVGNFIRGLTGFDWVHEHPNGREILVVAGGQGYVVNPASHEVTSSFGGVLLDAHLYLPRNAIIFNHQDISFRAICQSGTLWESRRVSWDGLRSVQVIGNILSGEAWHFDDSWHRFELDLDTGAVRGGSYEEIPLTSRAT